jgi:predicted transcriptional regulator
VSRRPDGALESDILAVLWAGDRPMTPGDVRDALGTGLAYTTVMTVLSRLFHKSLVTRGQRGRAFAYTPTQTRSELAGQRMREILADAGDRASALSGFVGGLSKRDAELLRQIVRREQR